MIQFFLTIVLCFAVSCSTQPKPSETSYTVQSNEPSRDPAEAQTGALNYSADDICLNSLLDRSIWSLGIDNKKTIITIDDLIHNKFSTAQRMETLEKNVPLKQGSWETALIPLPRLQYPVPPSDFKKFVNNVSKYPTENDLISGRNKACLEEQSQSFANGVSSQQQILLTLSCGKLALTDSMKCQKGVDFLYKEAAPSKGCNGLFMTQPKVWSKIYSDPKYFAGIKLASDRLGQQIVNNNVSDLNLLETLKAGYIASKLFNRVEAEEAAWDTLAIISNGAQNTDQRSFDMNNSYFLSSQLRILSFASGIIDFDKIKFPGNQFSFPPEIEGSCLTTKPYHFWMAAYQARSLIKKGFSQREAMMAVHTYAKAYQTQGMNKDMAYIFEKPWNHPTTSVIRHDLTLNALGAAYGAGMLNGKKINIETIFMKVFAARNKIGDLNYKLEAVPLAKDQIKSFLFWDKMFTPDKIFKIVEDEIRTAK